MEREQSDVVAEYEALRNRTPTRSDKLRSVKLWIAALLRRAAERLERPPPYVRGPSITVWQGLDGRLFTTQDEAINHERRARRLGRYDDIDVRRGSDT